jgi:ArsR family transcriptional regulator
MPRLSPGAIDLVAERFRVLGEPTRLRLLHALRQGERTVTELVEEIGTTQANVSKHLQVLHSAGFVQRRREGTAVVYALADPTVFQLCDLVCGRLDATLEKQRKALR